jgi:hypothetical protein
MAIRITTPKGFRIEVDSIADVDGAVKAAQMLDEQEVTDESGEPDTPEAPPSNGDGARSASGKKERPEDENGGVWGNFVAAISDTARAALVYIREHPGVSRSDLAAAIAGGNHNALSGSLRSITIQAEAISLKKTLVFTQKAKREEGSSRAVLRFYPGKYLRDRGAKLPADKEDKEKKG